MTKKVSKRKPAPKGRSGKAVNGRKMTKKDAKKVMAAGSKKPFDRNWLTSPNNQDSAPFWTPPGMEVELTYASMLFMDKDGTPIKDKFLYTGAKVKIEGEFGRLNIDREGLKKDLEAAIDEVIRKHTRLEPVEKTTKIK